MTPKEKAEDLMRKMDVKYHLKIIEQTIPVSMHRDQIKHCALVAVDEIVKNGIYSFEDNRYWEEVKKEIEKL